MSLKFLGELGQLDRRPGVHTDSVNKLHAAVDDLTVRLGGFQHIPFLN
jgi:hypothetical protein